MTVDAVDSRSGAQCAGCWSKHMMQSSSKNHVADPKQGRQIRGMQGVLDVRYSGGRMLAPVSSRGMVEKSI